MTELSKLENLFSELNRWFVEDRMAVDKRHRRLMARKRKSPGRRVFWDHLMPDHLARECQYCGDTFLPDVNRLVGFVAAPPSVEYAHRRAHCGPICDQSYIAGLKPAKIDRTQIFERDGWCGYLCGQSTPPDKRGFAYVPHAPSIDHVIPNGYGTDDPDNLRCCCRLCNLEKGTATLWEKLWIYLNPFEVSVFSVVAAASLPRYPTIGEMVALWRRLIIVDGLRVDTIDSEVFFEILVTLSKPVQHL